MKRVKEIASERKQRASVAGGSPKEGVVQSQEPRSGKAEGFEERGGGEGEGESNTCTG